MYRLSKASKTALATCDPRIRAIIEQLIQVTPIDFKVDCGHRTEAKQEEAFREGTSKVHWPDSKHNTFPSLAVDIIPWPVDWRNRERFTLLAGAFFAVANDMGINVRWGGDFNQDGYKTGDKDQWDLPHFEIDE